MVFHFLFVKVSEDLQFEAFHLGVQCNIDSLSTNRVITVNGWSILDEIFRFLSTRILITKKKPFLNMLQQWDRELLERKFIPQK